MRNLRTAIQGYVVLVIFVVQVARKWVVNHDTAATEQSLSLIP